jgi:chromate transporter
VTTSGSSEPGPSLAGLFLGFNEIALSGFGGVLPWARRILVDRRRWLEPGEFAAILGLCQVLPGPNVINLSVVVGARYRGAAGALAASAGLLVGPFMIVVALAILYGRYGELPAVQGMLHGISAVGAGLILATGLRMARDLNRRPLTIGLAVATLAAIAFFRAPLPLVMLVLAPLGVLLSLRR